MRGIKGGEKRAGHDERGTEAKRTLEHPARRGMPQIKKPKNIPSAL